MEWRCEGSQRVTEVRWDRGRRLSSWDAWRYLILCGVCRTTFWCVIKLQARPVFYFLFVSLRVSNVWIQLSTLTTLTRRCPIFLFIDKNAVLNCSLVSFHGFTKSFSATIIYVYFYIYYLYLLCLRNKLHLLLSFHRFFGDQTVERLDLCSMLKKKQPDGYYYTETSLQMGECAAHLLHQGKHSVLRPGKEVLFVLVTFLGPPRGPI